MNDLLGVEMEVQLHSELKLNHFGGPSTDLEHMLSDKQYTLMHRKGTTLLSPLVVALFFLLLLPL